MTMNVVSVIYCWGTKPSKLSGLEQQFISSHVSTDWLTGSFASGLAKMEGPKCTRMASSSCWLVAELGLSPEHPWLPSNWSLPVAWVSHNRGLGSILSLLLSTIDQFQSLGKPRFKLYILMGGAACVLVQGAGVWGWTIFGDWLP